MHVDNRNAEILRLARLLSATISDEPASSRCINCEARSQQFMFAGGDATRQTNGRLRRHIETASAQLDLAFEDAEVLADQFGL